MEVEDGVGAGELLQGGGAHPRLQHVAGLEEPREVVEDELGGGGGAQPDDREPGSLGLGADDGEVLAHEGVEQGGFPGVGDAGERDMAAARHG